MSYIQEILDRVSEKNHHQIEFIQAVEEVFSSIDSLVEKDKKYQQNGLLERLVEPDRVFTFRVSWLNDNNEIKVNRGYRIEFNNAIGPYKGGLRFHPSVNMSILKFLGFEQIFKNSLTGLALGGGKGGSDFDPKGKSDEEVMRFCQSFMTELHKHIGPNKDIPAGDIGVGGREIGFLFGQYKRLTNEFDGVLTGKGFDWGGSLVRNEATGYGLLYFVAEILDSKKDTLTRKKVAISGSGNVAQFAAEKAIQLGAKVITMSDSGGYIYDADGISIEKLEYIKDLKNNKRGRIFEYAEKFGAEYCADCAPWSEVECDIALPCATQNEITESEAKALVKNGVKIVAEGANMPNSPEAIEIYKNSGVIFAPGKATNAGGVAVSGLEMSQNGLRLQWSRQEVDEKLKEIMKNIHSKCLEFGIDKKSVDYVKGANIAGFIKVADAMIAQGVV